MLSVDGDVRIPAQELATRGEAILATRGAGKSWLAAVQAEQLIEAGYPILILDVVGEYWSLKAKYPVVVFGGRQADVPLDPHIGKEIANVILDRKLQAVIDLTNMRRADQPFFVSDLCTELYEYGLKAKTPLWLLIEEAQNFVPQVGNPPCKRPILDIVEMGRHAGLGFCAVSHRSATIDKTSLGLCDIVIFKRLTLPHDLEVVRDFFRSKDPRFADVAKVLPGLADYEALIYYPLRLKEPIKFQVPPRATPHVAETPTLKLKEVTATPELSAVSMELTEYFQRLIKDKIVQRDESAELRSRIAGLQEELDARETRIAQLEHDLELAQRLKVELPSELLRIPGFTEKVEYLEKQLLGLYRTQLEKTRLLEEENKLLRSRLDTESSRPGFSDLLEELEALMKQFEISRKPLGESLKSFSATVEKTESAIRRIDDLSKGFVSLNAFRQEIERLHREYDLRIDSAEKAEEWRLNPSIIMRMNNITNEITKLSDTGKQVLKTVASIRPEVSFDGGRVALTVGRSPTTVRQYLKQLSALGWVQSVGRKYKNNIDQNVAEKLREIKRVGQEEMPESVLERCTKELRIFIQSL